MTTTNQTADAERATDDKRRNKRQLEEKARSLYHSYALRDPAMSAPQGAGAGTGRAGAAAAATGTLRPAAAAAPAPVPALAPPPDGRPLAAAPPVVAAAPPSAAPRAAPPAPTPPAAAPAPVPPSQPQAVSGGGSPWQATFDPAPAQGGGMATQAGGAAAPAEMAPAPSRAPAPAAMTMAGDPKDSLTVTKSVPAQAPLTLTVTLTPAVGDDGAWTATSDVPCRRASEQTFEHPPPGSVFKDQESFADSRDDTAVTAERGLTRQYPRQRGREYVSISDDVYSVFFLCPIGRSAFFYSFYVFGLKMALYTFLAIDVMKNQEVPDPNDVDRLVLVAQFLMLPVAVAMQEDLCNSYFVLSNLKYCMSVKNANPGATRFKFYMSTMLRLLDGLYSLIVNFVVLITATQVLGLFLNFAALQFLQTIDDIAVTLAADGYLTEGLEAVAQRVKECELPKKDEENWTRMLDSVFFGGTLLVLLAVWGAYVGGAF